MLAPDYLLPVLLHYLTSVTTDPQQMEGYSKHWEGDKKDKEGLFHARDVTQPGSPSEEGLAPTLQKMFYTRSAHKSARECLL